MAGAGVPTVTAVFACVAENRADWMVKVLNLVLSIRRFGGSASGARIVVGFVDGIEPRYREALEPCGVEIHVVKPYHEVYRYTNKLRAFDIIGSISPEETLMLLDSDVVVVADPFELIQRSVVRARPDDSTTLTANDWSRIYRVLEVPEPPADCRMVSSGVMSHPYWNGGVVMIPGEYVDVVRSAWCRHVESFINRREELVPGQPNFATDQIALAVAVIETGIPFEPLPVWANYPSCYPVLPEFLDTPPGRPILVHYHHHHSPDGFLLASGNAAVDDALDAFNRERSATRGVPYPGLDGLGDAAERGARWRALQRRLRRHRWYRSETARRVKRRIVNLVHRNQA